jgi:hypothetical protein
MADTVDIPVAGKQNKKVVAVVAVGTAGVIAYIILKKKTSGGSASASNAANTGIDPATGYPYGSSEDEAALAAQSSDTSGSGSDIDPATGYAYGSEQDEEALAAQSGSADSIDYGSSAITGTTSFTTNSEWAQQCEQVVPPLINSTTAQSDVAAAIGRFLAGLSLTEEQAQIIQVCESEEGPPPVGTFAIIPAPATTVSSGTPTDVVVPHVEGDSIDAATDALSAAGLELHINQTLKGGTTYVINSQTPGAGVTVAKGSTIDLGVAVKK